ncbi:hypothetical protein DENSPDRAFT_837302 [Dentipellis sp. KUC8613]|nr:hypothetical protein DENSPDRAFT_837302 [Dentipellis sp. KUC8613]
MSQSPLASFDPFAAHPFTNLKNASIPAPPPPSQYPHPIPVSNTPSLHHATSSHTPVQPSSLPSAQTPSPLTAPVPKRATAQPSSSAKSTKTNSKGIFVTFTPERKATPDLEDILAKKNGLQTWGKK